MKCFSILGLSIMVCSSFCHAQKPVYTASVSKEDRIMLVRSNIQLTNWHEKSFWDQYKNYLDKLTGVSALVYHAANELTKIHNTMGNEEALEIGNKMIAYSWDELALRREYFMEISREHNGIIGLQFLQTETVLDMIESSQVYEDAAFPGTALMAMRPPSKQAKKNIMINTLSLSPEEALIFFPVYERYEQEREEVFGENYAMYDLFSTEASDFTPALAKRQGYDFLTVMGREIMLKDKYFKEMNAKTGSILAARFLCWENYFSTTCKMSIWDAL